MNVLRDGDATSAGPSVVAIGVFDGLHLGHRAVIAQLIELADQYDAIATVVTFDPSPASVLAPDRAPASWPPLSNDWRASPLSGLNRRAC